MKEATFLKDSDMIGKQDPYLQFTYEEIALKTDVQDDAGLHAKFDDQFLLENIELEAKQGLSLVMEAYDKDIASSDLLGKANAISYYKLIVDENVHEWDLDLFQDYKKTGNVKFTTQFIWCEPDPPPNPLLNINCMLQLNIIEANFLKDSDLIGKQDPYIQFKYNGKDVKTDVKDDAGLKANFENEKFCLTQVMD